MTRSAIYKQLISLKLWTLRNACTYQLWHLTWHSRSPSRVSTALVIYPFSSSRWCKSQLIQRWIIDYLSNDWWCRSCNGDRSGMRIKPGPSWHTEWGRPLTCISGTNPCPRYRFARRFPTFGWSSNRWCMSQQFCSQLFIFLRMKKLQLKVISNCWCGTR